MPRGPWEAGHRAQRQGGNWQGVADGRWGVATTWANGHGSCWKNWFGGLGFLSGLVALRDPGMSGRLGVEVWA